MTTILLCIECKKAAGVSVYTSAGGFSCGLFMVPIQVPILFSHCSTSSYLYLVFPLSSMFLLEGLLFEILSIFFVLVFVTGIFFMSIETLGWP